MSTQFECARCGASIALEEDHTEIVRRDFVGEPLPSRIEHLCSACLSDYETFLQGERPRG